MSDIKETNYEFEGESYPLKYRKCKDGHIQIISLSFTSAMSDDEKNKLLTAIYCEKGKL